MLSLACNLLTSGVTIGSNFQGGARGAPDFLEACQKQEIITHDPLV